MDDVKDMKRGRDADVDSKSQTLAASKIRQLIDDEEQTNQAMEQEHHSDIEQNGVAGKGVEHDAELIIQEMQKSDDPASIYEKLNPKMKQVIDSMINGGGASAQQEMMKNEPPTQQSQSEELMEQGEAPAPIM